MGMILGIVLALALSVAGGIFASKALKPAKNQGHARDYRQDLEEAKIEAAEMRKDAEEKVRRLKNVLDEEEESFAKSLQSSEEFIAQKNEILSKRQERQDQLALAENSLREEIDQLELRKNELEIENADALVKKGGMSKAEATDVLREELVGLVTGNKEMRQKAALEEMEDDLIRHAKAVLQVVIQRLNVPSSVDKNSTNVNVRDENFKGVLIGKNGTNVAYLESLLPVAIIFNHGDSETIHVGGVNLFRRNIAKRAINRLQTEYKQARQVNHEMIREAVEKSEAEIMRECDEKGRWALKQMGIDPAVTDPEVINYTGRLYYRTSYGQNIIHHSLEMAYAARLIAELIGTDVETAMLGAFYHDLGKAIDHDIGGAHDDISKDLLEKHGYSDEIVHAAYAHHDKVPCLKPADFIVKAVDAISGGRPGARMESVTNYFERIQQLEGAAKSFDGVSKVLAMSAGRELRVLVDKDRIQDADALQLAQNIAAKISEEIAFPGIIKVNLIRQTKSIDYAKEKKLRK